MQTSMRILAIETSCDETGISIIEASGSVEGGDMHFTVLANTLTSQAEMHSEYGGVYPTLAKREHIKALPILLEQALKEAGAAVGQRPPLTISEMGTIAVTYGPGLEPALWTGITFAQDLAKEWGVPLVPVNHMEGHIFSALISTETISNTKQYQITNITYPAIALLISGGHTELVLIKAPFDYEYLGGTLDDAIGEAFDKAARMLGLGYPGGPIINKLAQEARDEHLNQTAKPGLAVDIGRALPRPMLHSKDFNFSFSGLKTAVLYKVKQIKKDIATKQGLDVVDVTLPDDVTREIAMQFEDACADVLAKKTALAMQEYGANTLIIGGGVAANSRINQKVRDEIAETIGEAKVYTPTLTMTGDNALMIAIAGYCRALRNEYATDLTDLRAHGTLKL